MALLDFLKKKEEAEKAKKAEEKSEKVSVAKTEAKSASKKTEKKVEKKETAAAAKTTNAKFSYDAIKQPHISEKASYLGEKNQYTFEISPNYNKKEIKDAVEGIYNVNVLSVNMIKIPPKKRRLGKTEGFRKSYKKAVVTVKEGQKIEIL